MKAKQKATFGVPRNFAPRVQVEGIEASAATTRTKCLWNIQIRDIENMRGKQIAIHSGLKLHETDALNP